MKNGMKAFAEGALVALTVGVSFAFAEEHCGAGIGGGSGGDVSGVTVNGGSIDARGGGRSEVSRGGRNLYVSVPVGYSRESLYNDVVANGREVGHYKATLVAGDSPAGVAVLGHYKVHDLGGGDCLIMAMMKDGCAYSCSRTAGAWTAWAGKNSLKAESKDEIYPVGSTYMNVGNNLPASIQAIGTWERIASGNFLMTGSGSNAGGTGGAASVTLSVEQLPGHVHSIDGWTVWTDESSGLHQHKWKGYWNAKTGSDKYCISNDPVTSKTSKQVTSDGGGAHGHSMNFWSQLMGSGWAHENRPPYLIVSIWKRTK